MEGQMSCSDQLSQQKLILLSQVPGSIPIIPLKCRPLSKRSPFLGSVARLPVMRVLVFSMTPNMLLVFAWAQFFLARTFQLGLSCQQLLLKIGVILGMSLLTPVIRQSEDDSCGFGFVPDVL